MFFSQCASPMDNLLSMVNITPLAQFVRSDKPAPNPPSDKTLPRQVICAPLYRSTIPLDNALKITSSLHTQHSLLVNVGPLNLANGHPNFLLHAVTRFHRLGLHHYYGFICHLTPTLFLNRFLNNVPGKKILPGTMQVFPG